MPKDLANDVTNDIINGYHVRIRQGKAGFYWAIYHKGKGIAVSIRRYKTKKGAKQGFKNVWCHAHMEIVDEC